MTDDDLFVPLTPSNPAATPRKCRRHEWVRPAWQPEEAWCARCGKLRDEASVRRGKSSRRLGSDQERRIERVYGPTKIGERGDPVDHLGAVWKWQSKATRSLPPKWLATIDEPVFRPDLPHFITRPLYAMHGLYGDRSGVVIRSYVHAGTRTRDWLFIRSEDALRWFGLGGLGWWVIPGGWWLDHYGRDEE